MTGTAREEAERLVATVLAMAGQARRNSGLGDLIAAVVPDPKAAARLAVGAGDFATGVASLMRAFSSVAEGTKRTPEPKVRPEPTPDQSWAAATRATASSAPADEPTIDEAADPWTAATREDNRHARREAAAAGEAAAAAREAAGRPANEGAEGWGSSVRTGNKTGEGVTRPTDPWAAAVANYANGDSPGETGVARTGGVDHDVAAQGTPAAAGDRDDRPGGDAPGGAE
ncbi:hypothetical protein [Actinoplanes sp. TFC3]|uniref:hypothetical protein n=1 Tax=Actinoplanes sp. TFC3 TaxID=1710355 RepID=UPI0008348CC4